MIRKKLFRLAVVILAFAHIALLLPCLAQAAPMHIRVGVKCKYPPYQFLDQNNRPAGLHIDIMDRIAEDQDLAVTYVVFESGEEASRALQSNQIDVVLGVLSDTETPPDMMTTSSISSGTVALIADPAVAQQITHPADGTYYFSTAFELGTISFSQVNQLSSEFTIVSGDQIQLFNHLKNREVDAVVGIKESILYQSQNEDPHGEELVLVNSSMSRIEYTIMARRSNLMLCNRLQQGVAQLRNSDEYSTITKKWITDRSLEEAQLQIEQLLTALGTIVILGAALVSVFHYWNWTLKQTVQEKTREIRCQMSRLEEATALQKPLIHHFPNSILILAQDGTVLLMNPRAEQAARRTGIAWDDPSHPVVHVTDLVPFGEIWGSTRHESVGMISSAIIPITLPDGRELHYRYQYYQLNQQGNCALLVEDVTEEEERRNELFEANKNQMLNRLIASIAHEIKNPLMSIQAFASVMTEQGSDPQFQQSFAQYVPQEVDRINRLVESLINYAKPSKSVKERVCVQDLVNECVYLASASAKNKKLTIACSREATAYIQVDRDQVKQALLNLLINSIESVEERMEQQPDSQLSVTVSAASENGWVSLAVWDEGTGMSEESIENCTKPFYTTKIKGAGMGLALAKQFVTDNGGRFRIVSELGRYTEITMLFKEDVRP